MILSNNQTLHSALTISGFVLATIILLLNIYLIFDLFSKMTRLGKFKEQDVAVYENKGIVILLKIWSFIIIPVFYTVILGSFIAFFIVTGENEKDILVIISEVVFLVYMIVILMFDVLWLKRATGARVVIKNNKLALLDDVIDIENIINIRNDEKRKIFFINYRNPEIDGNISQIKIKYHWELKDFLNGLEVQKEFI